MDGDGEKRTDEFSDFRDDALGEQKRLERLLACKRRFGVLPNTNGAKQLAQVEWTADIVDPEFRKNVQIFRRLICGAIGINERKESDKGLERLRDVRTQIKLPTDVPLTLEALLGRRFELEQTLLELGDEEYVRSRAADLYDEEKGGTLCTWKELYGDDPPPLLDDGDDEALEPTRQMLARLLAVKYDTYLPLRARHELKRRILFVVVPATLLLTVLFAWAIATVEDEADGYLLTAAAGAAGAALGGLIRLRDIDRGFKVREFAAFFLGQIVVGAAAGLLAFVVDRAAIVEVGEGTGGLAAFGFVVGFSEAAFLGLVGQIAGGIGAGDKETSQKSSTGSST